MSRTYELYLRDILKASSQINEFVSDLDADMFKADALRVNAVLYNLIIIGEAIKNIPDEVTNQYPTVR